MSVTNESRTFSHRAFWITGHGAEGLDPSILTVRDFIRYDDGTTIPAFARPVYTDRIAGYGPHRRLTDLQQTVVDRVLADKRWPARLHDVDQDNVARLYASCGHYAPICYRVWPDGHLERVDSPYGDGNRAYPR